LRRAEQRRAYSEYFHLLPTRLSLLLLLLWLFSDWGEQWGCVRNPCEKSVTVLLKKKAKEKTIAIRKYKKEKSD